MPIFTKRMLITVSMGAIAGVGCAHIAGIFSLSDPLFWILFLNRLLIGIVVGVSGFVLRHPFFFFPCYALRGIFFGAIISLLSALGVLIDPQPENAIQIFWTMIVVGALLGLVMDVVATKFAGEGKKLYQ